MAHTTLVGGGNSSQVLTTGSCCTVLSLLLVLQIAATAFVIAWAVRLGGFLVVRVWRTGHDSRFEEAKQKPFTFWIYWTMQVQLSHCAAAQAGACILLVQQPTARGAVLGSWQHACAGVW